jgi:hypothetical protein
VPKTKLKHHFKLNQDFCSAGSSEGNPDESTSKIVNLTQDEYLQGVYRYWIKGVSSYLKCAANSFGRS